MNINKVQKILHLNFTNSAIKVLSLSNKFDDIGWLKSKGYLKDRHFGIAEPNAKDKEYIIVVDLKYAI